MPNLNNTKIKKYLVVEFDIARVSKLRNIKQIASLTRYNLNIISNRKYFMYILNKDGIPEHNLFTDSLLVVS